MATITGQAKNWICPRIGKTKLKDFTATDADKFFKELGGVLGKRSLVMIKSTLRRSFRRAQVHNLIARNVVELIDLPAGQPGHPSRAMTQEQAATVIKTASMATITEVSREIKETTCRSCRAQLGIDETDNANLRLEALFVLSITLGLRPGELRKLTWDHVDLTRGVVHVWRSASTTGDTKTPKSKRSLILPKRAVNALKAHKARQDAERHEAGEAWHADNLVFCHENGTATRPTHSTGASPR
jgi:integrase